MAEVLDNPTVNVAANSNPYTAIGLQVLKILDGLGIVKGKTQHLDYSQASTLSTNLTNFVVGYENSQGNISKLDAISNKFIDAVIERMNSNTSWGFFTPQIIPDLQKLKEQSNTGKFRAVMYNMFLWIFSNLDAQRKETFTPESFTFYNTVIGSIAKENGIKLGELVGDGLIKPAPKTNVVNAVGNFVSSLFGGNNQTDTTNGETDNTQTYIFIAVGIAVFIIIILILRK